MAEKQPLGGIISLAPGRDMFLRVLPLKEESALIDKLALEVKRRMGPGSYFAANRGLLQWLRDEKMFAEWEVTAKTFAVMVASQELPAGQAVETFRATPQGVALEIYHRSRGTDMELSLKEIEAVVTEANATDLHTAILRVLEGVGPSGNESTH